MNATIDQIKKQNFIKCAQAIRPFVASNDEAIDHAIKMGQESMDHYQIARAEKAARRALKS